MSAPDQTTATQSEVLEATVEATSNPNLTNPQLVSRVVVSTQSVSTTNALTATTATGRQVQLPVVYFNLPRNRLATSGSPAVTVVNQNTPTGGIVLNNVAQVLPPGTRAGSFLPGLSPKITVNATPNSAGSSPTVQGSSSGQQPQFLTIRTSSQPENINSPGASQPHIVTIPKESFPTVLIPNSTQSTQQFVTMVPKSSFPSSAGSGQIVTIRAPILSGSGVVSSGGSPNQIVATIQAGGQATTQATLVPISSAGKPQVSHISSVMKNGTIPSLVSSSSKMILSTVPTLQKSALNFSTGSPTLTSTTATQSPTILPVNSVPVTNITTLSRSVGNPTITIVPPKDSKTPPSVSVVPVKESSNKTKTILSTKDSSAAKPTITIIPQKDTSTTTLSVLSSKEPSSSQGVTVLSKESQGTRISGINPVSLLSKESTVTLVSSKDIPPGSPITVLSSKDFALLSSKEPNGNSSMKLVSSKDSLGGNTYTIQTPRVTVLSANDSNAANPTFTIIPSTESVVDRNSPSMDVTPLNPGLVSNDIPNVTLLPANDPNKAAPTLTFLSSKDSTSSTPTFTILPSKDSSGNSVTLVSSKDSAPSSTFTIVSSKEGEHPSVSIVPSKEVSEDASSTQEPTAIPPGLTTLPFCLSPEMTVTASPAPTVCHPQFQIIGKDISNSATKSAQGFIPIDALVESKLSLGGVVLPESTTLTPLSELEFTAPKTDKTITIESMTVQREPVEAEIHADPDTKQPRGASLLISSNTSISKTVDMTESGSGDQLSKCLKDAVGAIYASKDGVPAQGLTRTAVISCGDDEDEVTLIKVNASFEETKKDFTAVDDDPDDIKIELIQCTEELESSKESDLGTDEISIHIEKKLRSPSPTAVSATTVNPPKVTPTSKLLPQHLPTSKSLSNIRSPSILKNHIANKANFLSSSQRHRPPPKPSSLLKQVKKEVKTEVKTEVKKEIKNEPEPALTSTPDDFDPIKALEWKNGVGTLPGSNLKFRVNEFGFIEIISDDDKERDGAKSSQQSCQNSDGSAGSADEKDTKPDKRKLDAFYEDEDEDDDKVYGPEDIIRCRHCGVYGLAADFVNQRYCNNTCQEGAALKKAVEFKREQEHRALKLRRKRRRLERISEKDVKKEDNADDRMEGTEEDGWSLTQTPLGSDDDNMSMTSNDAVETTKTKGGKAKPAVQFTWTKYLESTKAKGAPAKLFKDEGTYTKNKFKVGMKLEGVDPERPAHFCALSVAEVKGCRLRLHFDGYSDSYDFWVNIDSPEIFPVGWCQKNNRRLDPPRGFTTANFNWNTYLKACRSFAAPRHLFAKSTANSVCPNGFRIGMKLEAVDRKETNLICVATVADVLDNRILVHFDSWDDMYDYWVDPSSPYIHPVGWCAENNCTLTPPNEFKEPSSFSWSAYLKQTKSIPAPARAFKQRPPVGFKRSMRLEAVDKRVPQLIRVATVKETAEHRILLHFDGWPPIYDYWVDEDSPDIHRPGWSRDTKHPLEAPLTKDDLRDKSHCITPGCRGEGHIKGAKFATHTTVQNCPYAPENLDREGLIPDRLYPKGDLEFSEIPTPELGTTLNNTKRLVEGRRPLGRPPKWRRYLERDNRNKKRQVSEEDDADKRSLSPLETASKLQLELHQSVFEPGYRVDVGSNRAACWAKHSLPLHSSPMLTNGTDPHSWKPSDVAKFISTVSGLEEQANKFIDEEIDGEALLLMTQQDLVHNIGIKLGPAIKLYNCIVLLRQKAA